MCVQVGRCDRGSTGYNMLQFKAGKDCHNAIHSSASAPYSYPEASCVLSELNGSQCSASLSSDSFVTAAQRDVTGMWQELHLALLGQKENRHDVKSWQQTESEHKRKSKNSPYK